MYDIAVVDECVDEYIKINENATGYCSREMKEESVNK